MTNYEWKYYIVFFITLATIEKENLNDIYDGICEIIDHESTVNFAWLPSDEKI